MKVLERKNENHQEIFTVEMEPGETDTALEIAYGHLVKEVKIDGFRQGKAPRAVLEGHVGKDALFDQAMKDSLPDLIDNMLAENQIRAYATPQVRVTSREPVIFEATVPLPPDITLGDYNSIKIKPNPVVIEDKAVEEILEQAQHQIAEWEPTGAPAELKDMMVMDIESDVEGASYVSDKDANFQLMPGWTFPIPGFAEKLVGFKAGEEHEFDMKMPETFPDKEKAGRDVHFKVNIKDVRREKLPELNDEFARKASSGSGGIENLRAAIKADLQKRAQQTEDKAFEEKVIDALVEKSQLQYPPLLVDGEVDRLLQEYINRVRETVQSEDEFKSILKTTSQEKLHEAYRPQAEQRVKRNLVISKLIEAEKVDVGDAEIDFQITALTADSGTKISEQTAYLNKPENRDSLRWWLKTDKAKKLLVEKAKSE